jgi:hypothetical protein
MTLDFGKYRGYSIRDVPREYLDWLLDSNRRTVREIEAELERRDRLDDAELSWAERLVQAGFRALAQQNHPDRGGNTRDMQAINAANEAMKELLRTAKAQGVVR